MADEASSWEDDSPISEDSYSPKHEKRRNRWLLVTVVTVLSALLLGAAAIAIFYINSAIRGLNNVNREPDMFPTGSRPPSVTPVDDDKSPINILLIGSDTRGDERGRSDVMQLIHISGDRKNVYLMSIPRDSYVDIPGYGKAKINAAYSYGGMPLAIETVENLLSVPIDHVATIDFEGFVNVIDAVGGVNVFNKEASSEGGFNFPYGEITLTGQSALTYVRERYGLSGGDFSRAERQRDVIKAVLTKLVSKGVLTDPGTFREAVSTLGKNFTVDSEFTNDDIVNLGWQLRDFHPAGIKSFKIPTAGFGTTADGQSIVLLDETKLTELQTALRNDDMDTFYATI